MQTQKLCLYTVYTPRGLQITGMCARPSFEGNDAGAEFLRSLEMRLRQRQTISGQASLLSTAYFLLHSVPEEAPEPTIYPETIVTGYIKRENHPEGALYTADYRAINYDNEDKFAMEEIVYGRTVQVVVN